VLLSRPLHWKLSSSPIAFAADSVVPVHQRTIGRSPPNRWLPAMNNYSRPSLLAGSWSRRLCWLRREELPPVRAASRNSMAGSACVASNVQNLQRTRTGSDSWRTPGSEIAAFSLKIDQGCAESGGTIAANSKYRLPRETKAISYVGQMS